MGCSNFFFLVWFCVGLDDVIGNWKKSLVSQKGTSQNFNADRLNARAGKFRIPETKNKNKEAYSLRAPCSPRLTRVIKILSSFLSRSFSILYRFCSNSNRFCSSSRRFDDSFSSRRSRCSRIEMSLLKSSGTDTPLAPAGALTTELSAAALGLGAIVATILLPLCRLFAPPAPGFALPGLAPPTACGTLLTIGPPLWW